MEAMTERNFLSLPHSLDDPLALREEVRQSLSPLAFSLNRATLEVEQRAKHALSSIYEATHCTSQRLPCEGILATFHEPADQWPRAPPTAAVSELRLSSPGCVLDKVRTTPPSYDRVGVAP